MRNFRLVSSSTLALLCTTLLACHGSDTIISQEDNSSTPGASNDMPHRLIDRAVPSDDGEDTDVREPLQSIATVHGYVADIPFAPTHTIVLRGRIQFGDSPFATVFVASDVPNMCEHLQQGTLPANGTMLALALIKDEGDGPKATDEFFPGGEQGDTPRPMLHGFFRHLDSQCHIDERLLPVGSTAQKGLARLDQLSAMGGALSFDLGMGFDDLEDELVGTLKGQLQGPLCDAPKLFEKAGEFFAGKVPEGGCIPSP